MPTASHAFVSTYTEGSDPTMLGPNEWNAAHALAYVVQTKSANYTIATDANGAITDDVIHCTGTMTLTIPAAVGSGRLCMVVMDVGTVAVSVVRTGSDTIGNGTGFVSRMPGDSFVLTDEASGVWGLMFSSANERMEGCESTATAAGVTDLTNASKYVQILTGSTTHTIHLPVVTTFPLGESFQIINLSTGAVAVQSSGANAIITLNTGDSVYITCVLSTGTTASSWNWPVVPKITRVSLAGDFTTNTSTALSNITGLGFAIGNNETWAFECHMSVGNSGATGCSYGITVSAGAPAVECQVFGNTTSATAMAANRITALNTASSSTTFAGSAITTNIAKLTGVVVAGASDACTVYPAIRPRGAVTHTVFGKSFLIATRINP